MFVLQPFLESLRLDFEVFLVPQDADSCRLKSFTNILKNVTRWVFISSQITIYCCNNTIVNPKYFGCFVN